MRRTHDDWETTATSNSNTWRTPRASVRERTRRVTLEEPWESDLYTVPRPTRWTPEAATMNQRPDTAAKTPNPLQSPHFEVNENSNHDYDQKNNNDENNNNNNGEMKYLRERMDRQDALMERMMNELTLLRRELRERDSDSIQDSGAARKTLDSNNDEENNGRVPQSRPTTNRERSVHIRPEGRTVRPQSQNTNDSREQAAFIHPEGRTARPPPPPRTEASHRPVVMASAGAQFVAEFSELIELDTGQHELLASIMNQQLVRRNQKNRSTHF